MSEPYSIEMETALIGLIQALSLSRAAEVDDRFKSFEERWRNDRTHRAAETQMASPNGASTPLPQAVQKAEAKVYDSRAQAFEAVRGAIAAYLSYRDLEEEARHKRERYAAFRTEKQAEKDEGLTEHDRKFIADMRKHDAHPWHFDQLSQPAKAILADLVQWYHHDTQFDDPANPWRAIDALYANRTVKKPAERCGAPDARSIAAPPPAYRHQHVPDRYYRYGLTVELGADVAQGTLPKSATPPNPVLEADEAVGPQMTKVRRWQNIDVSGLPYEIVERPVETDADRAAVHMKLPNVLSLRELAQPTGAEKNMVDSVEDFGDLTIADMFLSSWSNRTQESLTVEERRAWAFLLAVVPNPAKAADIDWNRQFSGLLLPGSSDGSTVREVRLRTMPET